jgi:hypothetical protein
VLISVKDCVNRQSHSGWNNKLKNPMAYSGNKSSTFRLAAYHLTLQKVNNHFPLRLKNLIKTKFN